MRVALKVGVLSFAAILAHAGESTDSGALSPIVVTATRLEEASFDVPASINRLDADELRRGQLQVNLSESLISVPGVSVQSRQNYAQDLQLSVRGFGARSSFGVRGVRLYADGVPGTMPDGQGQFSQFDLGSADHIEVLRGPFSALYGNSSGGVIALFTQDAPPGYAVGASADYGSFNSQRYSVGTTAGNDIVNFVLDAAHFQSNGYREHSQAERNNVNAKVRFEPSATSTLTVVGNVVQTPFVQDPLGLTRTQLTADRRQAGTAADLYNTRKSLQQEQLGVTYENRLSSHDTLSATAYTGMRSTTQFQAIPRATQLAAPLYPGAVIDLDRAFYGIDLHATDRRALFGTPLKLVGGIAYDDLAEARKGYANYDGNTLGVEGVLRRDEANHVYDMDQYLQGEWDPVSRLRVTAGVRHSTVIVTSHGHLAVLDDADSSVRFSAVNPVAGLTFHVTPALNAYAAFGRGFETPTLNDLAYRSINGSLPGLNTTLRPARSNNYEVGLKTGVGAVRADLSAFYIKTANELAVLQNSSGRTVNQNIPGTTRRGAELALDASLPAGFSAKAAYTYIRAVVAQTYLTCTAAPCNPLLPGPPPANYRQVGAGSHLPAVPQSTLYTGLSWSYAPLGFSATAELLGRAQLYADDRNSDAAPAFWTANLRLGFEQETRRFRLNEYVRVDNLANRTYVGSVIVNETNAGFFEPAPGRTAYVMFSAWLRSAQSPD